MPPASRHGRVPWQGNYPAAVALALLALCPFIVLSTASLLFERQLVADLGTSRLGIQLADGLANAGYAFGAVLTADLIQRIPGRSIFLACEAGFVVGSALAALAPGITPFVAGRTLQGLTTGMLLVAALPPLVTNHGARRLPLTAAFINLGLFGVVTLGPLVGGVVGALSAWRPLFVAIAVLGVAGFVVGLRAFDRGTAPSPGMGFDYSAIPVAAAATFLPFVGVSLLSAMSFTSPAILVPLVLGLAALGTLLVRQYRKPEALMPLKLLAHTLPVTGVSVAMVAGAGFTTLIELAVTYLTELAGRPPLEVGALLATQLAGVVVAAWLFKTMLPTRWLPVLAFTGLLLVAAGGGALLGLGGRHGLLAVAAAGLLLGFGAGAGVAPGLFMAGLSVPSNRLGPTFALVELLRSEAAFLVGPILLGIATAVGVHVAVLVVVVAAVVGTGGFGLLLLLGGARPHSPDLEGWLSGDATAYHSPPLAATLRRKPVAGR
ncbi:MAG: MFS transporter [Streptosporangiales bacterium]|nr:MFS transporter [Streptosporangiales bacterium]MBO0892601.1 MFS transporter [Acidothermales bacterium]